MTGAIDITAGQEETLLAFLRQFIPTVFREIIRERYVVLQKGEVPSKDRGEADDGR